MQTSSSSYLIFLLLLKDGESHEIPTNLGFWNEFLSLSRVCRVFLGSLLPGWWIWFSLVQFKKDLSGVYYVWTYFYGWQDSLLVHFETNHWATKNKIIARVTWKSEQCPIVSLCPHLPLSTTHSLQVLILCWLVIWLWPFCFHLWSIKRPTVWKYQTYCLAHNRCLWNNSHYNAC